MIISSEQIKAARALVHWEQWRLAKESGVSLPTIGRLESQSGPLAGYRSTVEKLKTALESAGVAFIAEDEISDQGGAGVRLVKGVTNP